MSTCFALFCFVCVVINYAMECDTSWTHATSTFKIPNEIDSLFIPFKLSNYLFIIGTSTTNDVLIYYHNLNNYTSLLSSLYDKSQIDYNSFKKQLNDVVSKSLSWNLLKSDKQLFSKSNDSIYSFLSYPSTFFVDELSNDIYIVSPINKNTNSFNSELWKLHIDIRESLLPSIESPNVDMSFYWENMAESLYDLSSSCVVYDQSRDTAFMFGGITQNGYLSNKVQAYHVLNETWTSLANMISPRRLSACSIFNDSFIYVFGGNELEDYGTVEIYDIKNNRWTQLNSDEIQFPFSRYATSAIQLQKQNLIYIIGGMVNYNVATSRIGVFNPSNQTLEICKTANNSLQYKRGAATSLVISDTIWTFGGLSQLNENLQFDPSITIGISYSEYLYDTRQSTPILDKNDPNNVPTVFGIITFNIAIIVLIVSFIVIGCLYYMVRCCIKREIKKRESISVELMNHARDDTLSIQRQSSSEMTEIQSPSFSPSFPAISSYFNNSNDVARQPSNQISSFNPTVTMTQQLHLPSESISNAKVLYTPTRQYPINKSKTTVSHPTRAPLLGANNYDTTQKQRVVQWLKNDGIFFYFFLYILIFCHKQICM